MQIAELLMKDKNASLSELDGTQIDREDPESISWALQKMLEGDPRGEKVLRLLMGPVDVPEAEHFILMVLETASVHDQGTELLRLLMAMPTRDPSEASGSRSGRKAMWCPANDDGLRIAKLQWLHANIKDERQRELIAILAKCGDDEMNGYLEKVEDLTHIRIRSIVP